MTPERAAAAVSRRRHRADRQGCAYRHHRGSRQGGRAKRVVAALAAFHREQSAGDRDRKSKRCAKRSRRGPARRAFASLLRAARGRAEDGSQRFDRAPRRHNATANAADDRMWQTVRPALEACALQRAADARARRAAQAQGSRCSRISCIARAKTGEVMRVTARALLSRARRSPRSRQSRRPPHRRRRPGNSPPRSTATATGVGRSLAIEILEFLDTARHHPAHR